MAKIKTKYKYMWEEFGVGQDLSLKVEKKTEELLRDKDLSKKIEKIYDDMIKNCEEYILFK